MDHRTDDFETAHAKTIFDMREERWEHVSYNTELDILELIRRGDVETITHRIRGIFPKHDGHLSDDPHRQAMYEFVASITLVARFAIEGGMNTEAAHTLSDAYIKSADRKKDTHDIYATFEKMLIDFASRVRRAKNAPKRLSLLVQRCMEFIENNTHSKITLQDLGLVINRSPAYLCVQFKRETGIALTDYINRQKMEETKHLLRDHTLTIAAIAATLAYCSQSYFAKVFCSIVGETPSEFRLSHLSYTEHR